MSLRVAQSIPVVIGVVIISFLLTRALPGDPAVYFAGAAADEASIEEIRVALGLDKSLIQQFFFYVGDLLRGDLGQSISSGQPVASDLANRLPASLELTLTALTLSCGIAIPLGILAATRPGSWVDHLCRVLVTAGVSLVLGANLGSAIIPVWLSRGMKNAARRVPVANLALRGSGALLALVVVNKFGLLQYIGPVTSAQTLINAHILFNAILLMTLFAAHRLEAPFVTLLPDDKADLDDHSPLHRSTLDETVLDKPHLAIANLRREVLRMVQLVDSMLVPIMDIYTHYDHDRARKVRADDHFVNTAFDDVRRYASELQSTALSKQDNKRVREMTEYAIAVETAGDIVAKRMIPLAKEMSEKGIRFSDNGAAEIRNMHERTKANLHLASNLLVSDDLESARLLLEEKQEMARLERKSRKRHLKRLSEGVQISFDSSDIHLETVGALRDFNSHIASAAYPLLYRGGQLLETRLIEQDFEDLDVRQR